MATQTQKKRAASGKTKASQEKLAQKLGVVDPAAAAFQHVPINALVIQPIAIRDIKSNSQNPRESAPHLTAIGHGIFYRLEGADKKSLVELALSDRAEDRAEYVKAVRHYESGLVELANNFRQIGQRQPVGVRPIAGGYDLIFGCRRVLAVLFNYCDEWEGKQADLFQPVVHGVVTEETDEKSRLISLSENLHRLAMNPMEQARIFGKMRTEGLSVNEIADISKIDGQVVRMRLGLLKLKPEDQNKVEEGELGVVKALKLVKGENGSGKGGKGKPSPGETGKGHKGDGTRRKAPSISDLQNTYETREPDGVYTEDVRRWIATELIDVAYLTWPKLQKEKKAAADAQQKAASRNGEKDE